MSIITDTPALQAAIRDRFAHVASCPFQGERVFFENAGGALTLKSVVETTAYYAAIPDNQGRANVAAAGLMDTIAKAKSDAELWFNAPAEGQVFVGESGTELLFRLIRTAIMATGGRVIGSTVEHPATRSACTKWSAAANRPYTLIPHDDARGLVTPERYAEYMTPDVTVATILHTSPVTGMGMDIEGIAKAIRAVAPEAFIVVDGIQHASHGQINIGAYGIDGYVISPYKVFSRHGYGLAWVSDRMTSLPHDNLLNGPEANWEFGTRDTGAYATFSDVVAYFDWLGGEVSDATDPRARIEAAGHAIHEHEQRLTDAILHGVGNLEGLSELPGITILGGIDNPAREGLVSFALDGVPAADIVETLNADGIRTHTRKADHYSGNILTPLGMEACVRVSLCHYNTLDEVARLLSSVKAISDARTG